MRAADRLSCRGNFAGARSAVATALGSSRGNSFPRRSTHIPPSHAEFDIAGDASSNIRIRIFASTEAADRRVEPLIARDHDDIEPGRSASSDHSIGMSSSGERLAVVFAADHAEQFREPDAVKRLIHRTSLTRGARPNGDTRAQPGGGTMKGGTRITLADASNRALGADAQVFLALRWHAGKKDRAAPKVETLAENTTLSERTVQRATARLAASGSIAIVPGGKHRSGNVYIILDPDSGVTWGDTAASAVAPENGPDARHSGVTWGDTTATPETHSGVTQAVTHRIPRAAKERKTLSLRESKDALSSREARARRESARSYPKNRKQRELILPIDGGGASPSVGNGTDAHSHNGATRNGRTEIPRNWSLGIDDRKYARPRWNEERIDSEFEIFRNHYIATGDTRADWSATWRAWVARDEHFNGHRGAGQSARPRGENIVAIVREIKSRRKVETG